MGIPGNPCARNLFLDGPISTGNPPDSLSDAIRSSMFCSGVFPKPSPGSSIIPSLRMPAASAASALSARKRETDSTASPLIPGALSKIPPSACIITAATPVWAHSSIIPGALSAFTSLTMEAPMEMHLSATSGFIVSTDTGMLSEGTRSLRTGTSLDSSSSADTGSAPGLVDSPPMSMMDAPASAISMPWRTAAAPVQRPPSEKESGVALRTPMMTGGPERCPPA